MKVPELHAVDVGARLHLVVKHCERGGRQHAAAKLEYVNVDEQPQSEDLLLDYVDAETPHTADGKRLS